MKVNILKKMNPIKVLLMVKLNVNNYGFMLHKATFNNISVILWRSVLLVGETEYLEKTADK
jgi:hypothetical protein